MELWNAAIEDLVRRIVEAVHPLKIILFGSAARDDLKPSSDVDLLVVMPDGVHRRRTAQELYRKIRGVGVPFDLVVATPRDLEMHKDNPGLIYRTILEEGKEVYAAARSPSRERGRRGRVARVSPRDRGRSRGP